MSLRGYLPCSVGQNGVSFGFAQRKKATSFRIPGPARTTILTWDSNGAFGK